MANADDSGEKRKKHVFQILSLDGGGIKGMFSAGLLGLIEDKACQGPITKHFDLITGTSTGGIIALGLGVEKKPEEICKFYQYYGDKIFTPKSQGYFAAKYPSGPLENALKETFRDSYGRDKTLLDCKKRLMIPAYGIDDGYDERCHLFETPPSQGEKPESVKYREKYQIRLWQIGLATSAAPTYFPVCKIKAWNGDKVMRYIDGGMWANNPVVIGITEAKKILKSKGIADEKDYIIRVLRIGTGKITHNLSKKIDDGGIADWAVYNIRNTQELPLLDIFMAGQAQSADYFAKKLIGDENFVAIEPELPGVSLDSPPKQVQGQILDEVKRWKEAKLKGNKKLIEIFTEIFAQHEAPEYVADNDSLK